MIKAQAFVEAARGLGFDWYAGVPCSFLTPFINYVINDSNLHYISSANEGDAVAAAAGATIGGQRAVVMLQNSGLGNAISPLTSLTNVFRIPVLIICTHRGAPGLKDEPQHELMGRITAKLLNTMEIPWEKFPTQISEISPVLRRADEYMKREKKPYALIMSKGTIEPGALNHPPQKQRRADKAAQRTSSWRGKPPPRHQALKRIVEHTKKENTVLVATTGFTGRELFAVADRDNHLYMVGSMGCASSLGLGLAMVRPDLHVLVVDGDGAALMRMGSIATIGAYAGDNLTHIVLDNEAHDSTGAQATVSGGVNFARIAEACGYSVVTEGDELSIMDSLLDRPDLPGPRFVHLKIQTGTIDKLPRPDISPDHVLQRLINHIQS